MLGFRGVKLFFMVGEIPPRYGFPSPVARLACASAWKLLDKSNQEEGKLAAAMRRVCRSSPLMQSS